MWMDPENAMNWSFKVNKLWTGNLKDQNHYDKFSGLMIFDRLGIEAVYPRGSEGRGPGLRVHDLVQHLPGLDRVGGALAGGGVSLKCNDGIMIIRGYFVPCSDACRGCCSPPPHHLCSHRGQTGTHIPCWLQSFCVKLDLLADSDVMTWVVGCSPENCFVNYAGLSLRGNYTEPLGQWTDCRADDLNKQQPL